MTCNHPKNRKNMTPDRVRCDECGLIITKEEADEKNLW